MPLTGDAEGLWVFASWSHGTCYAGPLCRRTEDDQWLALRDTPRAAALLAALTTYCAQFGPTDTPRRYPLPPEALERHPEIREAITQGRWERLDMAPQDAP